MQDQFSPVSDETVAFEDEWGPGYRRQTIRHADGREETRELRAVAEPEPRYGKVPYRAATIDCQSFGLHTMDSALARDLMKAARTIDELRAILAPLLDDWEYHESSDRGAALICRVCLAETDTSEWRKKHNRPLVHAPDCPVLRKDELLGR